MKSEREKYLPQVHMSPPVNTNKQLLDSWGTGIDVLNIKHIVLIAKDSGLLVIDYPISGAGLDIELLTGFIQANITFSESGSVQEDTLGYGLNQQFYEFLESTGAVYRRW